MPPALRFCALLIALSCLAACSGPDLPLSSARLAQADCLPGERGLSLYRRQMADGIELYPGILEALEPWAKRMAIEPPHAVAASR